MFGFLAFGNHQKNTWIIHTISKVVHLCSSPKALETLIPHLNVQQLMEPVATDTFFANCKALIRGDTCAQVYYSIQSCMINVYPMKTESHGPVAYEDFLHKIASLASVATSS